VDLKSKKKKCIVFLGIVLKVLGFSFIFSLRFLDCARIFNLRWYVFLFSPKKWVITDIFFRSDVIIQGAKR